MPPSADIEMRKKKKDIKKIEFVDVQTKQVVIVIFL
jgi:hypothetical protein